MIKINLFLSSAFLLASFFSVESNAQTKIWGVGSSVGVAEAEFQNAFVQEDSIGASYSPTSWTALTIYEDWGSVMPGSAYWTRSTLGYSRDYYSHPPYGVSSGPLPSPSQPNGIAIFDSGFMDNDSTANIGVGSSPAQHKGVLISPRIDLTGYTDSALIVKFFSHYRISNATKDLSVSMSTDDGATWSDPFDYRAIQNNNDPGFVSVPMPHVTTGVSNLTQCRIRFSFETYYFYAMIDDVTLETSYDYDMAIAGPSPTNTSRLGRGDIVRIGGNRYNPLSNLDPTDLKEWFWGAKLINYGGKDLLPQDDAKLYVSIDFYEEATAALTPNVYLDTMDIDTLRAGDYDGVAFIEYLRDIDFIINNGKGSYRVKYWVGHNGTDAFNSNDTVYHTFDITGTTTSYLSKARKRNDGTVRYSRAFFPQAGHVTAFEWGSVYYFPKGQTNNLTIDSVDFRYQIPRNYNGPASQTLLVHIYSIDDGSGATAANGIMNPDELTLVGISQVVLSGLDTLPSSYGLATASNFVDAAGNPMGVLNDNGLYYVSILEHPAMTGGAATFTHRSGLWIAGDFYNYSLNTFKTSPDVIINPGPLFETEVGQSPSYYWVGYGTHYVPSIGIHLAPYPFPFSVAKTEQAANTSLAITPNPTSKELTVQVDYKKPTDVEYILINAAGTVVFSSTSEAVLTETKTIDMEALPLGVYFLTAKTDEGSTTKRVVKQ